MKCKCDSELEFSDCCGPILDGAIAPTAEALLRARFTAFAIRSLDFVDRTHAPEVREDFNRAEAENLAENCTWNRLYVIRISENSESTEIEFVADVTFREKRMLRGAASKFRRINGEWFFVSSKNLAHVAHKVRPKIGRNDVCSCGSGKKYKKCCATLDDRASL